MMGLLGGGGLVSISILQRNYSGMSMVVSKLWLYMTLVKLSIAVKLAFWIPIAHHRLCGIRTIVDFDSFTLGIRQVVSWLLAYQRDGTPDDMDNETSL